MATLTNEQLSAMQFGYLTGNDLIQWASPQLLIKQYEVNPTSLQNGVNLAYGEVISNLNNRYAIQQEFNSVSSPRSDFLVYITSILAVRNILGNMAGISELLINNIADAKKALLEIREGQQNLPIDDANIVTRAGSFLVPSDFSTIG
jgi:hypothetical protein